MTPRADENSSESRSSAAVLVELEGDYEDDGIYVGPFHVDWETPANT